MSVASKVSEANAGPPDDALLLKAWVAGGGAVSVVRFPQPNPHGLNYIDAANLLGVLMANIAMSYAADQNDKGKSFNMPEVLAGLSEVALGMAAACVVGGVPLIGADTLEHGHAS